MSLNRKSSTDSTHKPNWLQHFFIMCSGANKNILVQCPTEYNKYSGIGATIFLTAMLASISGGYALYTAFFDSVSAEITLNAILISGIFGVFWGLVIFNLDRYIVLSLRKDRIPTKTEINGAPNDAKRRELKSERSRMLWNQALMASPRFLIALVIALTISKPIELRLFSSRIEKELERTIQVDITRFDEIFNADVEGLQRQIAALDTVKSEAKERIYQSNPIYNEAKQEEASIKSEIEKKESEIREKEILANKNRYLATAYRFVNNADTGERERQEYQYYKYNSVGRRAIDDKNRLAKDVTGLKAQELALESEIAGMANELRNEVSKLDEGNEALKSPLITQLSDLKNSYSDRKEEWIKKVRRSSDLLARMEALGNLSSWFNTVWWASLIITLLFILLETAPVVVKLLTKRGPYDEILDRIEYEYYLQEQEIISRHNMKINELLEKAEHASKLEGDIFIQIEKQRLDFELQNNETILAELAGKQAELAKISINNWYDEELKKMSQNINTNTAPTYELEDVFWVTLGTDKSTHCFRSGLKKEKEYWYSYNGLVDVGQWSYQNNQTEIKTKIDDKEVIFSIIGLSDDKLELKQINTNEHIVLSNDPTQSSLNQVVTT